MVSHDPDLQVRKQVAELLKEVQGYDVDGLSSRKQLPVESGPDELVESVRRLVKLYRQLPVVSLTWLTNRYLVDLVQSLKTFRQLLAGIEDTQVELLRVASVKDDFVGKMTELYGEDIQKYHSLFAFAATTVADFAGVEADGRFLIDRFEREIVEQRSAFENLLQKARVDVVDAIATKQAEHFKKEADRDSRVAWFWFSMTLGGIAVTIAVAIAALFAHTYEVLTPTSLYEAIQLAVGKVVVLASVGSFAVLAGRQYAANRHNEVVNRHRCNALRTYRALVEAAGDNDVRGIVLAQAAHAIFADQPTGFTRTDTSDGRTAPLVNLSHRSMGTGDGGVGS